MSRPIHIAYKNGKPFETLCGKSLRHTKWVKHEERAKATCTNCRTIALMPAGER